MDKDFYSMITTILESKLEEERWGPDYWSPEYLKIIQQTENYKHGFVHFGDLITYITYGQVGQRKLSSKGEVIYLQVRNIGYYGEVVFEKNQDKIRENSYNDPKRSRIAKGDILFINSGWPSLGRCIYVDRDFGKMNVSQHIDVIRIKGFSPATVAMFFSTDVGRKIIERTQHGVSGMTNISFDEVKSLIIPQFPKPIQESIQLYYTQMLDEFYDTPHLGQKAYDLLKTRFENLKIQVEDIIFGKRESISTYK
jgi:restriction endonuclease S subunit